MLYLSLPCLGCIPWVWQCLIYISHTLLGHTLGTLVMSSLISCYICLHCAWCVCVYACVCVCVFTCYGWSCTLYDGLSWLGEQPSHNNGCSWPCGVGMHSRRLLSVHIRITLYAWSSRYDCLNSCPSDIGFPVCATHINMLDALVSFCLPKYEHVEARHIQRHETLSKCHSAPNVKLCRIFAVKMKHLCCHILTAKAW